MNGNYMKRKFLFIHLLCLVCLSTLFVSCSEDEQQAGPSQEKVWMSFSAGSNAMTFSILTEGNKILWEAGDAISLFDPTGQNNELTTAQGGAAVTFTGKATEADGNYYALYPYDKDATISGTLISTTLSGVQEPRAGSFAQGLNPSVAVADANRNLYFRNVCAVVKFTLDSESEVIRSVRLSGNNGEALAGPVKADVAASDPVAVTADNANAVKEIELAGEFTTGNTYYIISLPGTLSNGLTLKLYNDKGMMFQRKGSSKATLIAGRILNLGTIKPTSFQVPACGAVKIDGVYHIYNAEGLECWRAQSDCLNSKAVLEADIDMNGVTWTPLGSDMQNGFAGDFNGNGKTISNLTVSNDANAGFFGGLSAGAKVHDVTFTNANVSGKTYVGTVAGTSLGIIENCKVNNSEITGQYAGAITGNNSVQVNKCLVSDTKVIASTAAGGIAGTSHGKVEYCSVTGNSIISSSERNSRAGGIVGQTTEEGGITTSGRLLKCATDGITVSGSMAGGIAGENGFGTIAQCVANNIKVTHNSTDKSARLGGVVGYNSRGDVVACYSAFSTVGTDGIVSESMGGIVGYNYTSKAYIYGCYSTHITFAGSVSGTESGIGAIAGYSSGNIISCYAILADGVSGINLTTGQGTIKNCVQIGSNDFNTLITGVQDLTATDGTVWKAENIWKLTQTGSYPEIQAEYIGE